LRAAAVPVSGPLTDAQLRAAAVSVHTPNAVVSTGNSTTTPLGIGATFTGAWEDVLDYSVISIVSRSNVNPNINGVLFQFSADGVTLDRSTATEMASPTWVVQVPVMARYFRIVYTNGGSAQANFALTTIYHTIGVTSGEPLSNASASGSVSATGASPIINAHLVVRDASGIYRRPAIDSQNYLHVGIGTVTTTVPTREAIAITAARAVIADSATDVQILAANTNRRGATIYNDSSATLYLGIGTGAVTLTDYTVRVPQNSYYEVPAYYSGQIRGIWASDPNDGAARVTEMYQ
jgi:hypothetical protein